MEQPSFALIPSGFNTAKVYSVIPESGVGDFDFDRSQNTATRINKDGLIESVNADIPRLNYEVTNGVVDSCPHLLLEMNSTNNFTYSSDFTQSWIKFNNLTVSANQTTSPQGMLNADKLISANATNEQYLQNPTISTTSGDDVTISCFVKKLDYDYFHIRFTATGGVFTAASVWYNIDNGTLGTVESGITAKIEDYGNGWYRCSATRTATGTGSGRVRLQLASSDDTALVVGDGVKGTFIFGAQWEEESYATSYIPTSGSTQSRASESCTGAGDVNTFNSVEGILYAEMKRDITTDNGFRRVNINDGSADNTVRLGYSTVTNEIKGVVTIHPSTSVSLVFTGLSVTEFRKMALLYKANRIELWVDGSKRAENTTTSVTFPVNTLNDLSFEQSNGSDKLRAKVKDVRYYDTDGMSNTEITNLLTQLTQ
tara:strand:- start:1464 stop:2744 length:1281 start_codon:yes stop_codon:yes gene_type:complete